MNKVQLPLFFVFENELRIVISLIITVIYISEEYYVHTVLLCSVDNNRVRYISI